MREMKSVEYTNSEVESKQVRLTEDIRSHIKDMDDGYSTTQLINEALYQFFGVGGLAAVEREICEDLWAAGIPVPTSASFSKDSGVEEKNKIIHTGEYQSENQSKPAWNSKESTPATYDIVESLVEQVRFSSGERGHSYTISKAMTTYLGMSFKDRFERVRSLRQLLKAHRGEEVEDPTRFIQRRMQGTKLETETDEVRVYEDLFSDDFNMREVVPGDSVSLSESEVIEFRHTHEKGLKDTPANRAGVLVAVTRHKDKDVWTPEDLHEINNRINGDIKTDHTREGYVEEALPFVTTGVEFGWEIAEIAEELVEDYVEQKVEQNGEYTNGGKKRAPIARAEVDWMLDKVEELERFYESYEKMGADVVGVVEDVMQEKPKEYDAFVFNVLREAPEEMWEAEGLGETVADDLAYALQESGSFTPKVASAAENFAGLQFAE